MRKKQTIIAAIVVGVAAIIVLGTKLLGAPGAPAGMPDHITIAQAMADKSGQVIEVGGDVVPGSISWSPGSQSLSFTLAEQGASMQVVYNGVAPNDFKPGIPLVVTGKYSSSGVFRAEKLTTRGSPLCKACHAAG